MYLLSDTVILRVDMAELTGVDWSHKLVALRARHMRAIPSRTARLRSLAQRNLNLRSISGPYIIYLYEIDKKTLTVY